MPCNCKGNRSTAQPTLLGTATPTTDGPYRHVAPDGQVTQYPNAATAEKARARYGGRIYPLDTA